jgi:PAS domain S-box-containing protein
MVERNSPAAEPVPDQDGAWRDDILRRAGWVMGLVGTPFAAYLLTALQPGRLQMLALVALPLAGLTAATRLDLRLRALLMVATLFFGGLVFVQHSGPSPGALLCLILGSVLAALVFGTRFALALLAASAVGFLMVGTATRVEAARIWSEGLPVVTTWVRMTVSFTLLTSLLILLVGGAVRRIERGEERLRQALDAARMGTWEWDVASSRVVWAGHTGALLGLEHVAMGTLDEIFQRIHPDDAPGLRQAMDAALSGATKEYQAQYRVVGTDPPRWLEARGMVVRDAAGAPRLMRGTVADVSARKRAQLIQAAYGKIAALANAAADIQEVYRGTHEVIGGLMPARNFCIALWDAGQGTLSFPYFVDEQEKAPPTQPLGRGLIALVLRRGKPLLATPDVVAELMRTGEIDPGSAAPGDWLGVPLITSARTLGVLAVQSHDPDRRHTQQEMDILAFVSNAVALALERRLAEVALATSERRYRLLFERNLSGFCRTTVEGRVLECNDAFAQLLGYADRREAQALEARDFYFEPRERDALISAALREGMINGREVRLRRKDGAGVWVILNETVIQEGDPPTVVFETTLFDITARRFAEAETRALAEMKTNFMVVTSHEMRTPLTVLMGHLGLMRLGPLTPTQEESVRRCDRTLERLRHSLDDILSMLQLERGRLALSTAPTDLAELSRSVVEELRPFAERRKQRLNLEMPSEVPTVSVDAGRMRVALGDLVQNAIKFTPDGGEVAVSLRVESPWLHVIVSDTGIGIEQSQLDHVFQHFYTASDPRHHHSGTFEFQARGAGLGLAIVKGYAESHRGRAWAESAGPGRGSAFHVLLPLKDAAESTVPPWPRSASA